MTSNGDFTEIPIVDLSRPGAAMMRRKPPLPTRCGTSATTSAFMVLTGHGIDPAMVDDVFSQVREAFFDLPEEIRNA